LRYLYTLILTLLTPFVLLRLLWRGRRNPGYRRRWGERFGFIRPPALRAPIWVHAVSVGEVQAAAPLIRRLIERYPERGLVVTTTTPTGSSRVQALFGERVFHCYLPYDLPAPVNRFLRRVRPAVAVVMETELWPNLFAACDRKGIAVLLANARLSPKSAAGYGRFAGLTRQTLSCIRLIAAQSEADAQRFRALGAPRVETVGNIKYDLYLPEGIAEEARALRQQWGAERPVWIAASTHEGEEEAALDAFAAVRKDHGDCLLIVVPRHPERFDRVAELCTQRGYGVARRSAGGPPSAQTDVLVVDTLGELLLFYAAADVAFVGGSLVPVGGHNMLEPAALGVPVISGPHLFNFSEVGQLLSDADALVKVNDGRELAGAVMRLLDDSGERREMGERGRAVVEANRGALDRLLSLIVETENSFSPQINANRHKYSKGS
jgi:3-deoxy-D-manno-octulosonic-acid transferase